MAVWILLIHYTFFQKCKMNLSLPFEYLFPPKFESCYGNPLKKAEAFRGDWVMMVDPTLWNKTGILIKGAHERFFIPLIMWELSRNHYLHSRKQAPIKHRIPRSLGLDFPNL